MAYDKRGIGKSQHVGNKHLYCQAGVHDLVSDAVQAYQFLVQHDKVDNSHTILAGHSEGVILIAFKHKLPPPKGCVFLADVGEDVYGAMEHERQALLEEVQNETGLKGWILQKTVT